jgi:uncharacterized membrane protein
MTKQPLSQAMRQWLFAQVDLWRDEKLLSEDQANAILDLYETPTQSSARQQSAAIYVLLSMAALFIGLAVLLVIGYNWEDLPAAAKLIIIFATISGTYACAFLLRFRARAKVFSEVVFFLGAIFYGAGIWLVAQVFHLNAHYPDGFWWWAVGILPIALCLDTVLVHMLVVAVLAAWVGTEILGFAGVGFWFFGRFPFLPNGCYTLPIFAALGLGWAYHKNSPATVALYVPLVAWWVILQPFSFRFEDNPIFYIGSVGAMMLIFAEAHRDGSRFAIPYRLWGALLCMGVLSIVSFRDVQREFIRFDDTGRFFLQSLIITLASGVAFAAVYLLQLKQGAGASPYARPLYAFAIRLWLPVGMVGLMFGMTVWHAMLGGPANRLMAAREGLVVAVPTIFANIAMLALAFWLMLLGLREERGLPFAGGVLYFLLWSVMRYIDLFGDFGGLLGASCMFFTCGAALAGFALFWHSRKKQRQVERRAPDGKMEDAGAARPVLDSETAIRPRHE